MITPLQVLQIDTTPDWVFVKAVAPPTFAWEAGTYVEMAIPEPSLVPHASFRSILASSTQEGLVEFMVERVPTPLVRHLSSMKQGDLLYLKPSNKTVCFPDHGVWVALQEAVSVMRGSATRLQQTANDIDLVLVQTKKAYFADLTRIAGQNPSFTIHVADTQPELLAILRHLTHRPVTVVGHPTQINWLKHLLADQDLRLDVTYVTLFE